MGALPTGRPGQFLALALTIIGLTVIWVTAVLPALTWFDDRAEALSQQRLLVRRMSALAETLPALRSQAEQAGAAPAAEALLRGSSDAVAGAALQQLMQDMGGAVGISFTSVETLPPQQEGRYRRIRLRLAFAAPWPVLVRLLAAIQQAKPQMLIDNLALEASQSLVHADGLPLNASFTVLGFREEAAATAAQ